MQCQWVHGGTVVGCGLRQLTAVGELSRRDVRLIIIRHRADGVGDGSAEVGWAVHCVRLMDCLRMARGEQAIHPRRDGGATTPLLVGRRALDDRGGGVARRVGALERVQRGMGQVGGLHGHHAGHTMHASHGIGEGRVEPGFLVGNVSRLGAEGHGLLGRCDGLVGDAPVSVVIVLRRDKGGRGRVLQAKGRGRARSHVSVQRDAIVVVEEARIIFAFEVARGRTLDGTGTADGAGTGEGDGAIGRQVIGQRRQRLRHHRGRRHGVEGAQDGRGGLGRRLGGGKRRLLGGEGRRVGLLGLGELLKEGLRGIVFKRQGGLADGSRGGVLTHLFALEVALKGVEKEAIMGHAVPVKDLLLLLCANAIILVEKVEKGALGFFEGGIGARLEVP